MPAREDLQQPPVEAVRAGLSRITASAGFANAERMRRFLTFVVNKTIEGEGDTLKEYVVGIEVFCRPDFDPRTDTIVRVEARRLRKKLQEYYADQGRQDPVVISLPSGSYAPLFGVRAAPEAAPRAETPRRRRLLAPVAAVLSAAALIFTGVELFRRLPGPAAPVGSVAVLPFLDMSPAKDQEYLCDGLSEELINALSAVPTLRVAARTSTFRYKGKADDVRRIGAELGVEHIVEGSVRTSGRRLRVTAQLVRARDGYHVWSREFDREFAEVFAMEEELARAVASSVGAELGPGSTVARAKDVEAYRLYLEGRHRLRQFQRESAVEAVDYFQKALSLDGSFAPAYAGIGDSYMQMNMYSSGRPAGLLEKSRQFAARALTLDPRSAEAETTLGSVSAFYDWNWKASEQHFRRAIDLQPRYVDAHWLYATTCLAPQGRLEEALSEARRAVALDPLSPLTHTMMGAAHWYRRDFDPALAELDEALRLDPSYSQASLFKTFVYLSRGKADLVVPIGGQFRAYAQARVGDTAGAREAIAGLVARGGSPIVIAGAYAGLGQEQEALQWLEKGADEKSPQMIWVHFQAPFEALHDSPRYRAIRARMHLQ